MVLPLAAVRQCRSMKRVSAGICDGYFGFGVCTLRACRNIGPPKRRGKP